MQIKNLEFRFNLSGIHFRHCQYEDIAQVIYCNRATLPENYSRYTFLSMLRTYPDLFYVAVDEKEDKIVAYIMNKIDTGYPFLRKDKVIITKGHVFSIGVLEKYRKRGIASALLALAFKAMMKRNVEEIFLEVRVSNTPAIRLYEKFRMKIVHEIPHYYADGENAYVMAVNVTDTIDIVNAIVDFLHAHNKVIDNLSGDINA